MSQARVEIYDGRGNVTAYAISDTGAAVSHSVHHSEYAFMNGESPTQRIEHEVTIKWDEWKEVEWWKVKA